MRPYYVVIDCLLFSAQPKSTEHGSQHVSAFHNLFAMPMPSAFPPCLTPRIEHPNHSTPHCTSAPWWCWFLLSSLIQMLWKVSGLKRDFTWLRHSNSCFVSNWSEWVPFKYVTGCSHSFNGFADCKVKVGTVWNISHARVDNPYKASIQRNWSSLLRQFICFRELSATHCQRVQLNCRFPRTKVFTHDTCIRMVPAARECDALGSNSWQATKLYIGR